MTLLVLLILPFAGSLVTALVPTRARTALASWAGLVSAGAAAWILSLFKVIRAVVIAGGLAALGAYILGR